MKYAKFVVTLAILFFIAGCESLVSDGFPGSEFFQDAEKVTFTSVEKSHHASLDVEAQNRIIRDRDAFYSLWKSLHANSGSLPEVPDIDFSGEMVVVSVMGQKPTGGYAITIKEVASKGGKIGVHVVREKPGDGCAVTQALSNPYHIVKIPKENAHIEIFEKEVLKSCD